MLRPCRSIGLVVGLGVGILVLGLFSTGRWASGTAERAAGLFEVVERGADHRTASLPRR
jgi:hypothetical protein